MGRELIEVACAFEGYPFFIPWMPILISIRISLLTQLIFKIIMDLNLLFSFDLILHFKSLKKTTAQNVLSRPKNIEYQY